MSVLHGLLTSEAAFEDYFAVLNGLPLKEVLLVSANASVASVALFASRIHWRALHDSCV